MPARDDAFQKAMSEGHSAAWDQQWDKAAAAYRKALDAIPGHPKALSSLGLALYELQDFPEALRAYEKASQAAPSDPVPLEKIAQLSERLGMIPDAIRSSMKAAELYIKNQDSEKALENWVRVTQLDDAHITARSYLAMVHERLGHAPQAATEYLAVASYLQRSGNAAKAAEMVARAVHLLPGSPEVRQAEAMMKSGQLLPKPMRSQGGTAALRVAQVKQHAPTPVASPTSEVDPIIEASKQAIARLAEVLFDLTDDSDSSAASPRRGMLAIVDGSGTGELKQSNQAIALLHIGQAIDAQSKNQDAQAVTELEKALEGGFTDPALHFELGYLCTKTAQPEKALSSLQTAVKHEDYAFASRLLLAQLHHQAGRLNEASVEYLEALKIADSLVVLPSQSVEIGQLYEPIIEAQVHQEDQVKLEQLCDNIQQLLHRNNWREALAQAREQLPKSEEGTPPMPLAEIMTQAQSGQVIEAVARVRQLARAGHFRSAMDEAFESFKVAPSYLPLHTLVGDLLIEDGRTQDAIAKYTVVAQAYSVRGEAAQAVNLLKRIVQVAPMDLTVRSRLIEQLIAYGQVDEAIGEYLDLADIYYHLAELDMARKTYTTALRLAQQGGANRAWSVKLLQRMADIDMQHLDWRQALRVFEQLRTLEPDDVSTRKNLIDLNLRLNQVPQASDELENALVHLDAAGRRGEVTAFLEEMVAESPQQPLLRRALAEEYRRADRAEDAVAQLDALGETLLNAGDREGASQAIEAIIALNPPNQANYRKLLERIKLGTEPL
jgi:tetratricopeptide (TPR) repeat protein